MPEHVRLDVLSAADFEPHIGSTFDLISPESGALALTLQSVTPMGREEPGRRRAFSLLFEGPKLPALSQMIYSLRHEAMGDLDIFIVPIYETGEHRGYEAVFA